METDQGDGEPATEQPPAAETGHAAAQVATDRVETEARQGQGGPRR